MKIRKLFITLFTILCFALISCNIGGDKPGNPTNNESNENNENNQENKNENQNEESENTNKDDDEPQETPEPSDGEMLSPKDLISKMVFGWNLGNTLDATGTSGLSSETYWGQPKTTKAMIHGLKEAGINTIRIPVSWHNHITDTDTYEINADWMKRVTEIVDWAIAEDMYVILNIHHDNAAYSVKAINPGDGFYPLEKDREVSEAYLKAVWKQVAQHFKNYDSHLMFETLNEPRLKNSPCNHEWGFDSECSKCKEAQKCVNDYNALCVKTIRATGGNNVTRVIGIPGLACSPDRTFEGGFKLPEDDYLALAVHMYTPYPFAMDANGSGEFTNADKSTLNYYFNKLNQMYVSKGVPVYIGEMGATNKNNLEEREKWFAYFVGEAKKYNIVSVLWDNGSWDTTNSTFEEKYGFYNRQTQTWYFPTLIEAAITAAGGTPGTIKPYSN